jgi:hypothetical protein
VDVPSRLLTRLALSKSGFSIRQRNSTVMLQLCIAPRLGSSPVIAPRGQSIISPIGPEELWADPIMSCAKAKWEATRNWRTRMSALLQSQRDWVHQPRVARHELPWGGIGAVFNPNGVASHNPLRIATPLGLFDFGHVSQGSSCLATLGFEPESLWDSPLAFPQGTQAKPASAGGCSRLKLESRGLGTWRGCRAGLRARLFRGAG